jgi:hypothetical protein
MVAMPCAGYAQLLRTLCINAEVCVCELSFSVL